MDEIELKFSDESILEADTALITNGKEKTCGIVLTINCNTHLVEVLIDKEELINSFHVLKEDYPEFFNES